jgi:hypothetical protein
LLHSSFTSALDGSGQSQTLPLYLRTHWIRGCVRLVYHILS